MLCYKMTFHTLVRYSLTPLTTLARSCISNTASTWRGSERAAKSVPGLVEGNKE